MKKSFALSIALLLCGLPTANAQVAENTRLFKEIMDLDSQIFEQGFNQCKLDAFEKFIAKDLEFFHDTGGSQNRVEFMQAVKKNICSNPIEKPIRNLLAGSSKVFPLEKEGVLYGAIQQGAHQFHTKGTDPAVAGYTMAKFTHVWLIRDGQWKLKTALSFDHQQKTGKTATLGPIKKNLSQPTRLFKLSVASFTWALYFQEQN